MGNQVVLFKDPDQMIQKFLPNYSYCKTLCDQPLVTTMMCASPKEGHIVAKAFKTQFDDYDGNIEKDTKLINEKLDPRKQPNVLVTVLREIGKEQNLKFPFVVAYRQYIYQSLQEKLKVNTPNLCKIERKWLIHQLLCGVSQIHKNTDSSQGEIPLVHGDLKPENILVTSYNQVLITDLVRYKPSTVKSDDLKFYNYHFGELSNNQKCYFAPERFTEQPSQTSAQHLERSMDVFSTGCIIAEILQEGEVLFDLPKLTKYRKGEYNPSQDLLKKIKDDKMVDLIMSMIALKPEDRPSIEECLLQLNQQNMLPQSYSTIFYQLCSSFVRPQYLFSDMRISLLRKYMPSIWKSCFQHDISAQDVHAKFFEPLERTIFDKLREDDIVAHNDSINPKGAGFDFITPDDNNSKELFETSQEDRSSIITVVHWIGAFISSCYFPQTRRCALELLLVIGKESSLDIRLQYILPYVFKMFDDKQPKVVAKAIEVAVMMFENIIDSDIPYTLNSTDYRVFDNYIMPHFIKVQKIFKDVQMVQITYTRYLPILAKIGRRFTELSVISRLASDGDIAAEAEEEEETKDKNTRVANLDHDMENIRKIFSTIIKDSAVQQDPSFVRLMFAGLGSLCDFFGSQVTMGTLIPLLSTVVNKRDFLLKLACLQSVKGVAIKVGKSATSQMILPVIVYLLYDAEELVVLNTIRTYIDLLRNGLISRQALCDDYGTRGQNHPQQEHLVDKMIPFLLHPNTHIREAALNFIVTLSDYENVKILSKAEVVCVLRNKLKPYLKDPVTAIQFLMKRTEPQLLLEKLRTPLSRNTYENMVKTDQKKLENQSQLKKSDSDNYALNLESIRTVIEMTQVQYRSSMQVISESNRALQRGRQQKYSLYRVIKSQTLKNIVNINELDYKEPINISEYNAEDYQKTFFQPCVRISAEETNSKNIGINIRDDQTSKQLSEVDRIMQALCVLPELDQSTVYTRLANQSLPEGGKLQLEKVYGHAAQPTEMPQFHSNFSKTVSIPVETEMFKVKNPNSQQKDIDILALGNSNSSFDKFRPQGRLINTLHEHDHPVTSIAVTNYYRQQTVDGQKVTENQDMFLTASKDDGIVKVWSAQQVQQDVTANSIMSIKSECNINQVCTMDQSRSFCVAGTQGIVEVYDMERLGQGGNRKISNPNHALPDNFVKTTTLKHQNEGDIMNCMSTQLPATHQELFLYSTQRGSLFLHDIRCKASALEQKGVFTQQRGMVTCLSQGQDPYQILAGSLGGYVCVYDIRFNMISTAYKHNQKYPINSLSTFHPSQEDRGRFQTSFNRSNATSPMAVIAAGGQSYEVSLLNLDTGNIESILTVKENKSANQDGDDSKQQPLKNQNLGMELPSFYRESTVRDLFSGPERQGNNSSLYQRYLMQTRSLVSTQQIKLTQNIDKELLKSFKHRYSLIKHANESKNGCRKVLVPRKNNNLLQGTSTVDYVITGGNDARLRFWSLSDTVNNSYYINTPNNDECSHFQSLMAGGVLCLEERISRVKNFPQIDANKLSPNFIPNTKINERGDEIIKMGGTSVYYSILARMIQEGMNDPSRDPQKFNLQARQFLTKDKMMDINSGAANKYQVQIDGDKNQGQKITVWNYNGLSEWQHLNGLSMNHRFLKDTYQDRFAGANGSNNQRQSTSASDVFVAQPYRNQSSGTGDKTSDSTHEFIFRDTQNVSHSDAILDMAMIDTQETPMLITSSRDSTVKLWM